MDAHSGCLKIMYPSAIEAVTGPTATDGSPMKKSFGGATATNHPRSCFWANAFRGDCRLDTRCSGEQSVAECSQTYGNRCNYLFLPRGSDSLSGSCFWSS